MTSRPRPAARPASAQSRRLGEPGWLLLPLRGFLGVTFTVAGLQKLANPQYLNPHSPTSVAGQMRMLQHSSPLGPLLGLAVHAPNLVGLLIAFGELAVGIGTLIGLYSRIAAAGGALLSLTFFLTVSWNTHPYYYGADIVFLFAWTVLLGFGAGGVLALDGWLRSRARRQLRLPPQPVTVGVATPRLRALCPRGGGCGLDPAGHCTRPRGCPVFPIGEPLTPATQAEIDRRTVIGAGTAAALTAVGALVLGGLTAVAGRLAGGTRHSTALPTASALPSTPAAPVPSSTPDGPTGSAAGTAVGPVSAVPAGQARSFTDPGSGEPAWIVHPAGNTFVAFSAICTHAGCPVQYDPAGVQFVCPCHGGVYDARTGQVLQGPPPSPLPKIPVHIVDGQIRVDG